MPLSINVLPDCSNGYSETQLKSVWDEDTFKKFSLWMRGQTFSYCDGRKFDPEQNKMVASHCGPHGNVYYVWDVTDFLLGRPVTD